MASASSTQGDQAIEISEADLKTVLWSHVEILDRGEASGGNVKWKCKYCSQIATSSYSRVKAHLLKISNHGIGACKRVTVAILSQLKDEVAKANAELERRKPKKVSLPHSASVSSSSMLQEKRKRKGPLSPLEKGWALDLRNQLDAIIARMFYSSGLSFNVARNPYYQDSYTFAANHNLSGYVPPGYNKLRTPLLQKERAHIASLMERTKSTWSEKGVTICSDGWSDAQRRPLINFLAISEGGPMFLRAINAEGEIKSKEYIAEKLIAVIEEVGP